MAETNHCGSCTLCCKLMEVPELEKPAGKWCAHCRVGEGCKIYEQRPQPCNAFVCVWLGSQDKPDPFPLELRPDKSGMLFYYVHDFRDIHGVTDTGRSGAWRSPRILSLMAAISRAGRIVIFRDGQTHYAVHNGKPRPIELGAPDESGDRKFVRFLDEPAPPVRVQPPAKPKWSP